MGIITKEPLQENSQTPRGVAVAEQLKKATEKTDDRPQPSAKDRSIAFQVGLKVAGQAMANYAATPEKWLEMTKVAARALAEEILK